MNFDLSLYWKIFDFRTLDKTIRGARKNASLGGAFLNIAIALILSSLLSFLLLRPLLASLSLGGQGALSALAANSYSPASIALTLIGGVILYSILYGLLHALARALGGKGKLEELSYFLSALLPLYEIIRILTSALSIALFRNFYFVLSGLIGLLMLFYLLYIAYRVLRLLYPELSAIKAVGAIIGSGIVVFAISAAFLLLRIFMLGARPMPGSLF